MNPCPVFLLTEKGRTWLALLLVTLDFLELFVGLFLVKESSYPHVRAVLAFSQDAPTFSWLLAIAAALTVAVHAPGCLIAYECAYIRSRPRWLAGLHVWWLVQSTIYGFVSTGVFVALAQCWDLRQMLQPTLLKDIERYAFHPWARQLVDELQMKLQCCGIQSYTDWIERDWQDSMFPYNLQMTGAYYDYAYDYSDETSKKSSFPEELVPYSCCSSIFRGPCLRDSKGLLHTNGKVLNKRGCHSQMYDLLTRTVKRIFFLQVVAAVLQVVIVVVSRLLLTGIICSFYQEDPSAPAPCWLFNENFLFHFTRQFNEENKEMVEEWLEETCEEKGKKRKKMKLNKRVVSFQTVSHSARFRRAGRQPQPNSSDESDGMNSAERCQRYVRSSLVRRVMEGESRVDCIRKLPKVKRKHETRVRKTKKSNSGSKKRRHHRHTSKRAQSSGSKKLHKR